jgi:4'-phosphopantetheinyl transferase EntD
VAGRTALREALRREALLDGEPLLRDDRGAPQLPAAAAGSISHKGAWAAALVAPRQPDRSLGVDLEDARGPRIDISRRVLTERELAALAALDEPRRRAELALRFSLKEAIYKAIDPWVRRYVGFREVELALEGMPAAGADLAAREGHGLASPVSPALTAELGGCTVEVSWRRLPSEHWLSTARIHR